MRIDKHQNGVIFVIEPDDSTELKDIIFHYLPEWAMLFSKKNREYGGRNAAVLGVKGQFADIWRKIGKLKTALWDDKPEQLVTEQPLEILSDLIGHCFLTIRMIVEEQAPRIEVREPTPDEIYEKMRQDRGRAVIPESEDGPNIDRWERAQDLMELRRLLNEAMLKFNDLEARA